MKKKIAAIIMIVMLTLGLFATSIYATDTNVTTNTADLKNDATVNLVQIKDRELETLQDYQDSYGDNTYGLVAYILNIIRLYSIPFGFVGIAITSLYRYIIGIRKLDVRDKGFGAMIGIITVMVICQVLPLVFAIVVKGWRG
jgi:TRAP-type C4-dicarboxylate transport system permease small subunit